jgi:hypothetical protein
VADHVAVSAEVDSALAWDIGRSARPGDPAFDDIVANGLVALETALAAVVYPEVDVADVVPSMTTCEIERSY